MYDDLVKEVRAFVVEEFEQLAATFEFDGNMPRYEAERAAFHMSIFGEMPPERFDPNSIPE